MPINSLFVADETDLAGFGVDGRALLFDDIDRPAIEIDGALQITFLFGDAATIVEDRPIDIAVVTDFWLGQQAVVSGFGFGYASDFEPAFVSEKFGRQHLEFPQALATQCAAGDCVGEAARQGIEGAFLNFHEVQGAFVLAERDVGLGKPDVFVDGQQTMRIRGADGLEASGMFDGGVLVSAQRIGQREYAERIDFMPFQQIPLGGLGGYRALGIGDGFLKIADVHVRFCAHDVEHLRGILLERDARHGGAEFRQPHHEWTVPLHFFDVRHVGVAFADIDFDLAKTRERLVVFFLFGEGDTQREEFDGFAGGHVGHFFLRVFFQIAVASRHHGAAFFA